MQIDQLYSLYSESGFKVSTDSRSIKGGELFFALKGENFDGNDYALKALEKGARWAIVDRAELAQNEGIILVDDVFVTLQNLAIYHRNHLKDGKFPIIGISGTNGKTTTKNLIEAVLSRKFKVFATKGNLNNDIGVPLSLLSITPDTEIAVIEMGASHIDDIAKLVKVCQPDYGLLTNVGKAHIEGFGSFEGVKQAKGELYKYLGSKSGSLIFINEDDADLRSMTEGVATHFYGYGIKYQGVEILPVSPREPYLRMRLNFRQINTQLIGSYNANNILASLCVGEYFGVKEDDAIKAIEEFVPTNKRSQLVQSESNTLIVDAYNANPSSMKAALDNFLSAQSESKLALLGDMKELGEDSVTEHIAVLDRLIEAHIPAYLVGSEFRKASESLNSTDELRFFESASELSEFLQKNKPQNSLILIKGSHSTAMDTLVELL